MRCFFSFIFILSCFSLIFSNQDESLYLKKSVYTQNYSIQLSDIIEGEYPIDFSLTVTNSGFISNRVISRKLSEQGYHNYTVIGKGVEIIFLDDDQNKSLSNWIVKQHPDLIVLSDFPDLGENNVITDVDIAQNGKQAVMNISFLNFRNGLGISSNYIWKAEISDESSVTDSVKETSGLPVSEFYIEKINGTSVQLIYQKGSLTIRALAEIVEELDDNYYLVENTTSGKQLKVKFQEEDE